MTKRTKKELHELEQLEKGFTRYLSCRKFYIECICGYNWVDMLYYPPPNCLLPIGLFDHAVCPFCGRSTKEYNTVKRKTKVYSYKRINEDGWAWQNQN